MTKKSRSAIKTLFKRGSRPLASDFESWIDSYWHKDENIPMDSIEEIEDSLNKKQNKLTAGTNITINSRNEISAVPFEGISEETDPVFNQWKNQSMHLIAGKNASTTATSSYSSIVLGADAKGGINGIAIGNEAKAQGANSIAIGPYASAINTKEIALGYKNRTSSGSAAQSTHFTIAGPKEYENCFEIRENGDIYIPKGDGNFELQHLQKIINEKRGVETDPVFNAWLNSGKIAIGSGSWADQNMGIAIGQDCTASENSIVIGMNTFVLEGNAIAIGNSNAEVGAETLIVGHDNMNDGTNDQYDHNTIIGFTNEISGNFVTNIGSNNKIQSESINIVSHNFVTERSLTIGTNVGHDYDHAEQQWSGVIAIGRDIYPFQDEQILIGDDINQQDFYYNVPNAIGCLLAIKKQGIYVLVIDSEYSVFFPKGYGDYSMVNMSDVFSAAGFM